MGPAQESQGSGTQSVDGQGAKQFRGAQGRPTKPLADADASQGSECTTEGNCESQAQCAHTKRLVALPTLRRVSSDGDAGSRPQTSHRKFPPAVGWSLAGVLIVVVAFGLYLAWPILFPAPTGLSGQQPVSGYPTEVTATGEDGRTRTLGVSAVDGTEPDLAALEPGNRLVVEGSGYDAGSGIYVAICAIPDSPDRRPGPCLGGVPSTDVEGDDGARDIEWAAANWINDDWAWKLFGARGFDDREAGTFTAYIEVVSAADEYVDCSVDACGVYTRNDHTALDNRMQDLYVPVDFAE